MTVPVLVKRIVAAYRNRAGDRVWASFLDDPAPGLGDLQTVLNSVRGATLSPAEQAILMQIEDRRAALRACDDEVVYRDFGAGLPDETRSDRELLEGVDSRRFVADLALASVPRIWGSLLFRIVRHYQPQRLIELGSALGISGSFLSAGLKLNGCGHLYTIEGCPSMATQARQSLDLIGPEWSTVIEGRFQDALPGVLAETGKVDFAFIDGHHDEQATVDYWRLIADRLTARSIVVFDDIDWSAGMTQAWSRIVDEPQVSCAIDLGKFGLCLCHDTRLAAPRQFRLPLGGV